MNAPVDSCEKTLILPEVQGDMEETLTKPLSSFAKVLLDFF